MISLREAPGLPSPSKPTERGTWKHHLSKELFADSHDVVRSSTVRDRLVSVHEAYPQRLKFAFETWATKVLTCKTSDGRVQAYGVEAWQGANLNPVSAKFQGKGKGIERVRQWYAKNEVILSAGPFETPKLLMVRLGAVLVTQNIDRGSASAALRNR